MKVGIEWVRQSSEMGEEKREELEKTVCLYGLLL